MNILITGIHGFVGSNLIAALCEHHILPQHIPHYTVSSSLNRAEEDKLPGSRLQKEIKDPTRQSRIDIKIYLSSRLILRIMRFTSQMDDGIKVR